MITTDFNQLAQEIHVDCVAAGWWQDMNRPLKRTLMLVISELSEAMEGDRKDQMDDHLPQRKMLEVELADAAIRMLDLGGRYGWTYDADNNYKPFCGQPVAECLFYLTGWVHDIHDTVTYCDSSEINFEYTYFLKACLQLAQCEGLDLFAAIREKRAYNKQRADHKPEARAQANGKKY